MTAANNAKVELAVSTLDFVAGCQGDIDLLMSTEAVVQVAKYSWLRYSASTDGVIGAPCAIMLSAQQRRSKGYLVNSPFKTG